MIGFIADSHIGNHRRFGGLSKGGINRRCEAQLQSFERQLRVADEQSCEAVFVLGDTFHTVTPTPGQIYGVQRAIDRCRAKVYVLAGNHDSVSDGCTALDPLRPVCTVVDSPLIVNIGSTSVVAVPYSRRDPGTYLFQVSNHLRGEHPNGWGDASSPDGQPVRVLAMHFGMALDDRDSFLLAHDRDALAVDILIQLSKEFGYTHILSGHWHEGRSFAVDGGPFICRVGGIPTSWTDRGFGPYNWLTTVDDSGQNKIHIVSGPRFVRCQYTDLDDHIKEANQGDVIFAELITPRGHEAGARAVLHAAIKTGDITDGQVVYEKEDQAKASKSVVMEMHKRDFITKNIVDYVASMETPIDATIIINKVVEYIKKSSV